ncbi:hypothetical protein [Aetokthonos hydrillicola]|jgi:hypothetical protein|uniref:hypothetical protein n=1 Tax=Aetokthonos hydrillicola TaxID=1550245 RepID=UPI001ABA3AE4|nr:hypothetical protein [Aetokthonos hydrillicola]MBO3458455.1 hypothetical protein [Aetokthonos hydrillicola CCALA 1050]MBW4586218.1 hypothetical protein [Aetokthonos hydrillicola CCALA 1050]
MLIYKRISYVQIENRYQTYIHPVSGNHAEFIRYKVLENKDELEDALNKCREAGWLIVNATNLVNKMNLVTSKRPIK